MRDNVDNQSMVAYGTKNLQETHTQVPSDNKQFPGDKMPQNAHIVFARKRPQEHRHIVRHAEYR